MNENMTMLVKVLSTSRPDAPLPVILTSLSQSAKEQIDSTLSNDENSTDKEIVAFWIEECGIAEPAAKAAIAYRGMFFTNPLFQLFSENPLNLI